MRKRCWSGFLTLVFAAALATQSSNAAEAPKPLELQGTFGFVQIDEDEDATENIAEQRKAASGIACSGEACVVVFDEGRSARFATLRESVFKADGASLMLREGKPKKELDTEGAAIGGGMLYVVGSHAKARKVLKPSHEDYATTPDDGTGSRCKAHKDSRGLFRFAIDPATGLPAPNAKLEDMGPAGLIEVLKGTAVKPGIDVCLDKGKGLDIEGLAFKKDRLYFGFRGPKASSTRAYVLSADPDALFAGTDAKIATFEIEVGEGRAIRDMQSVDDGFLILAGPDDVETNADKPFSLVLWSGKAGAESVTTDFFPLPSKIDARVVPKCTDKETKPEAISATATASGWKVVVLSDGLCDGGPMWFDVKRP